MKKMKTELTKYRGKCIGKGKRFCQKKIKELNK